MEIKSGYDRNALRKKFNKPQDQKELQGWIKTQMDKKRTKEM